MDVREGGQHRYVNVDSRTWTAGVAQYLTSPYHNACFLFHLFQLQKILVFACKFGLGFSQIRLYRVIQVERSVFSEIT